MLQAEGLNITSGISPLLFPKGPHCLLNFSYFLALPKTVDIQHLGGPLESGGMFHHLKHSGLPALQCPSWLGKEETTMLMPCP